MKKGEQKTEQLNTNQPLEIEEPMSVIKPVSEVESFLPKVKPNTRDII